MSAFVFTKGNALNRIIYLPIANTFLLLFTAWIKYKSSCPTCDQPPPLPISSATIALSGAFASAMLAIIILLTMRDQKYKVIALMLSVICASAALYLQVFQLTRLAHICYFCLGAAILFIAILGFYLIEYNRI